MKELISSLEVQIDNLPSRFWKKSAMSVFLALVAQISGLEHEMKSLLPHVKCKKPQSIGLSTLKTNLHTLQNSIIAAKRMLACIILPNTFEVDVYISDLLQIDEVFNPCFNQKLALY